MAYGSSAEYNSESLSLLKDVEPYRKFPHIYLGSGDLEGAKHTVIEILGNALDEASNGYGNTVNISLNDEGAVTIQDFGRGIPMEFNSKEGLYGWQIVFTHTYGGGKYASAQDVLKSIDDLDTFTFDDYPGLTTVGMHGVGAAVTQFTSDWMVVESCYGGHKYTVRFSEGLAVTEEAEIVEYDGPSGTTITWVPSADVFTDARIPSRWLQKLAFDTSVVAGVNINYTGPDGFTEEYPASSPEQYVSENTSGTAIGHAVTRASEGGEIAIAEGVAALGPMSDDAGDTKFYHNTIAVTSGVHTENYDRAVESFFQAYGNSAGVRFKGEDFHGLITGVISTKSTKTTYRGGQTKKAVDSVFVGSAVYNAVSDALHTEQSKGTAWITDVLDIAVQRAELRVERENLSKRVREVTKVTRSKGPMPSKFVSCRAYEKKQYDQVELWIAEGDSAIGSLQAARDSSNQALYPVRGKGLNLFKADIARIINNKEVQDLIKILGAGVDLGAGLDEDFDLFDFDKLKVGRIVIASDADKDGLHIRMLLIVLIWRLFPELIKRGMVYIAESPLYEVTHRGKKKYFYTEAEFANWNQYNTATSVSRNKGLGEVDAAELRETTMKPGSRRLIQVEFDPADTEILGVFDVLFGNATGTRKHRIMSSLLGEGIDYSDIADVINNIDESARNADITNDIEYEVVTA